MGKFRRRLLMAENQPSGDTGGNIEGKWYDYGYFGSRSTVDTGGSSRFLTSGSPPYLDEWSYVHFDTPTDDVPDAINIVDDDVNSYISVSVSGSGSESTGDCTIAIENTGTGTIYPTEATFVIDGTEGGDGGAYLYVVVVNSNTGSENFLAGTYALNTTSGKETIAFTLPHSPAVAPGKTIQFQVTASSAGPKDPAGTFTGEWYEAYISGWTT